MNTEPNPHPPTPIVQAPTPTSVRKSRKHELLFSAVELVAAGRKQEAAERLNHLLWEVLDIEATPEDLTCLVFGAALSKRLDRESHFDTHRYLRQYAVPQIQLFNLLATRVPYVYLAGLIANNLLCEQMRGEPEVSLIDVGIGTGRQMVGLLRRMARKDIRPERMILVGIEPAPTALGAAGETVLETADELGLNVELQAIQKPVEELTPADWSSLAALPGKRLINEFFTMYHMPRLEDRELRQDVLERLRGLGPAALVLSEPSVDHVERDLGRRFMNCWEHFSLAFRALDELDLPQKEKNALKVYFFGRKIESVLSNDEGTCPERHESVDMWRSRLARAGFEPGLDAAQLTGLRDESGVIQLTLHQGHVGLDYEGKTLVAVMVARSSRD